MEFVSVLFQLNHTEDAMECLSELEDRMAWDHGYSIRPDYIEAVLYIEEDLLESLSKSELAEFLGFGDDQVLGIQHD